MIEEIEFDLVVKMKPKKVTPVTIIITSIEKGKFRFVDCDISKQKENSLKDGGT